MEINLVRPCGFCPGAKKVVERTLKIIADHPSAKIYIIGKPVHNSEFAMQIAKYKNVKVLDNKNSDRLALVKKIKQGPNIVIFSAHGTDPKAINYVEAKGWKVYDLTCPYVSAILSKINYAILHGYHVAYYGDKNHAEAVAAKAVGKNNLTIYKTEKDLNKVLAMPYVHVMSQSTMNVDQFQKTWKWFTLPAKIKYSNAICFSSRKRQENVKERKKYDIVFVITDPASHNGKTLCEVLSKYQKHVVAIDPLHIKLTKDMLKNKRNCAIFTSSSVSDEQISRFVKKLKSQI